MARRRLLSPEQLREIADAARRPLSTHGWAEATRTMPTDPKPPQAEAQPRLPATAAGHATLRSPLVQVEGVDLAIHVD
jgi:hypothetical protein